MYMGYFIDPEATPINKIDFNALAKKGITAVYIRVKNADYKNWDAAYKKIVASGIRPYIWVWQGFKYTEYMANKGWHVCLDMEKYDMPNYYAEIKAVRAACKGKMFILCTKAQDWDGDQKWSVVKDYCDVIMPMAYIGDYGKSVSQLVAYMKAYNTKYPGKIRPALETYVSDAKVIAKSKADLMAEINGVAPYCNGVALFRYGISNY